MKKSELKNWQWEARRILNRSYWEEANLQEYSMKREYERSRYRSGAVHSVYGCPPPINMGPSLTEKDREEMSTDLRRNCPHFSNMRKRIGFGGDLIANMYCGTMTNCFNCGKSNAHRCSYASTFLGELEEEKGDEQSKEECKE